MQRRMVQNGQDALLVQGTVDKPGCAPGDRLQKGLSIDGEAAFVTLDGCPSEAELGGLIWDVVVLSGGRAYDFTIDGALDASEAEVWLASIRLDPAAARTG